MEGEDVGGDGGQEVEPPSPTLVVARLRSAGVPLPEIAITPFPVLAAIWREFRNLEKARAGQEPDWNPELIADCTGPDGLPPEELFVAYGVSLGADLAWVRSEWERQKSAGGIGRLPDSLLTPEERPDKPARPPNTSSAESSKVAPGRVRRKRRG